MRKLRLSKNPNAPNKCYRVSIAQFHEWLLYTSGYLTAISCAQIRELGVGCAVPVTGSFSCSAAHGADYYTLLIAPYVRSSARTIVGRYSPEEI
jgi:hypothetical protein